MIDFESTEASKAILNSIREHLVASARLDAVHNEIRAASDHGCHPERSASASLEKDREHSLVDLFKANLEAVDGQCIIAEGETAVVQALREILTGLQNIRVSGPRVALSDACALLPLAKQLKAQVGEIAVAPDASALFAFDVGITAAQAAIAETGTLVLQSDRERHRLVSLLPPVHIAIIEANQLCLTLGEALAALQGNGEEVSPTITFITGPSRTADIELTLAIGVHGPQKLFVIINTGQAL
jgi:L-lactate dehydrogenase complex protein LldG